MDQQKIANQIPNDPRKLFGKMMHSPFLSTNLGCCHLRPFPLRPDPIPWPFWPIVPIEPFEVWTQQFSGHRLRLFAFGNSIRWWVADVDEIWLFWRRQEELELLLLLFNDAMVPFCKKNKIYLIFWCLMFSALILYLIVVNTV